MNRLSKILIAAAIICGCMTNVHGQGAGRPAGTAAEGSQSAVPAPSGTAAGEPQAPGAPVFHIQLWDGHKTGWEDEKLADAAAAGFTVIQNGWKGSLFPSLSTLDKLRKHGLLYGAYIDTRQLFREEATSDEKAKVLHAIDADGSVAKAEFNTFDPIYQAAVRRGVQKGLARLAAAENLYKIMLNSEHGAPISYDDLTVRLAIEAGVLKEGQRIPQYARGVAKRLPSSSEGEFADPYAFLGWYSSAGGDNAVNRVAAEAAHAALAGVLVTTDPLADGCAYGQYQGMDVLQDWVRLHQAPRDPLSIAYHAERLKAHVRKEGRGEIWIGPQLGTKSGGTNYAAPADLFEEGLWLAAAFGARGVTIWGYDTVRHGNPLDDDTWSRIAQFRKGVAGDCAPLVGAKDAPRKCAVLLSKANQVFSTRVYYDVDGNYENFYRALLTAHVPADVLYDEDVLAGRLSEYKALFLPGIEHSTPELDAAISGFEKSGGRVVRWPVLLPRYVDYEITKGNAREDTDAANPGGAYLYPHQYSKWRQAQAAGVFEAVADLMDVTVDNPDVVLNVVEVAGKRYAVLVNDSRTYGAWTTERGYKWCEDAGLPADATLAIGRGEGRKVKTIHLQPAGIALVPLEPTAAK